MIQRIIITDLRPPTSRPPDKPGNRRAALIDSALRFAGFTIQPHPAGYRIIVREGAK